MLQIPFTHRLPTQQTPPQQVVSVQPQFRLGGRLHPGLHTLVLQALS